MRDSFTDHDAPAQTLPNPNSTTLPITKLQSVRYLVDPMGVGRGVCVCGGGLIRDKERHHADSLELLLSANVDSLRKLNLTKVTKHVRSLSRNVSNRPLVPYKVHQYGPIYSITVYSICSGLIHSLRS